jgi:hypothetical protein
MMIRMKKALLKQAKIKLFFPDYQNNGIRDAESYPLKTTVEI